MDSVPLQVMFFSLPGKKDEEYDNFESKEAIKMGVGKNVPWLADGTGNEYTVDKDLGSYLSIISIISLSHLS